MDVLVARLAAWMSENHGQRARLTPPATDADVAEAESVLGVQFPEGLRALWRWTAGGEGSPTIMNNRTLMDPAGIVRAHDMMAGFVKDGTFEHKDWWHETWVPFLTNGAGSYLCWDPKGSFKKLGGVPGQILEFWNKDRDRNIWAPSFEGWLEAFVDSFDAGLWTYDEESGSVLDRQQRSFRSFLGEKFPGYPKEPLSVDAKPVKVKAKPKAKPKVKAPVVPPDLARPVRPYAVGETYAVADRVEHPTLGTGVVEIVADGGKISVRFGDEVRVLVHARTVVAPGLQRPPRIDHSKS